jgi:hypothetical protein
MIKTYSQILRNRTTYIHTFTWATGLSIFISCLGLLGLAMYTTNLRTKEIGVRKVLGASVAQIVRLLSTELILLIVLAFVIVTPAGLVRHEQMDGNLCRQYNYQLVDICTKWRRHVVGSIVYAKLPNCKGSGCQPSEKFEK